MDLESISLRQDNAGCYHSAATILGVHQLAIKHNVSMRMDFSDPQDGKGPCDRKAENIKNHMRSFLNSGHDISNAEDMQSAIQSHGGIRGVATVLCGSLTIPDPKPFPKWDGVSFIDDIQMNTEGMRVWRAYGVGDGKEVQQSNFALKENIELPSLVKITDVPRDNLIFCNVIPRKQQTVKEKIGENSNNEEASDTDEDTLFTCPEDGCVRTFQRFSSLQKHQDVGRNSYVLERETFLGKAMKRYARNLEEGTTFIESQVEEVAEESMTVPSANMGWALKHASTSRRRLNEKQKKYLVDLFLLGEQTGRKANPDEVSKSMRKARNSDGFFFVSDEYLTSQQITSFFSRMAAKKSIQDPLTSDDDDDDDDLVSAMAEKEFDQVRQEIMNEIAIQHPIIYGSYNICQMTLTSKLSNFSIAMVQDICKQFEKSTLHLSSREGRNLTLTFCKNW